MKDGDVKLKRYPDIKLAYVTMVKPFKNLPFEFNLTSIYIYFYKVNDTCVKSNIFYHLVD